MSLKYYIHPYFIFNLILCLIYPTLKILGLNSHYLRAKDSWGYEREYSLITGIGTLIVIRFLRYFTNYKKLINEILFYVKLGSAACMYFVDYRLAVWYSFGCIVVFILFRPPQYDGPSKIEIIPTEENLSEVINRKDVKGIDNYTFAIFYSNLCENCIFVIF